jgi:hypothetical protein
MGKDYEGCLVDLFVHSLKRMGAFFGSPENSFRNQSPLGESDFVADPSQSMES